MILYTYLALSRVFEVDAVEKTAHDPTSLDLLLRVRLAPRGRIGAVDSCGRRCVSNTHTVGCSTESYPLLHLGLSLI